MLDLTGIVTGLSNVCQVLADALYSVRMDHYAPTVRIGELSRRVGLSVHVLRAWESRYGLITPVRTDSGYRLYSAADERRVRRMRAYLADGLSPAQAARAVLADDRDDPGPAPGPTTAGAAIIRRAMDDLDEMSAQAALDRLFAEYTVETVIDDVLMPYLQELGERWVEGSVSVAQEHFASNVIRGRLAGLARGWGAGRGPIALLACPAGERHELALLAFGIALHRLGWRIHYLGTDTPLAEVTRLSAQLPARAVVMAATMQAHLQAALPELRELGAAVDLVLAGAGATSAIGAETGAIVLSGSPAAAAAELAERLAPRDDPHATPISPGTAKEVEDEQHPHADRGAGDPAR